MNFSVTSLYSALLGSSSQLMFLTIKVTSSLSTDICLQSQRHDRFPNTFMKFGKLFLDNILPSSLFYFMDFFVLEPLFRKKLFSYLEKLKVFN